MFKYTNIKPAAANAKWGKQLNESYAGSFGEQNKTARGRALYESKMDMMTKLAAIKEHADGGHNASERKLFESYGVNAVGNIMGMGAAQFPSDPGTEPGNQEGSWVRPDYKKGSGDVPSVIFGLAMNVAAYTVGFDIVNTIPVDTPVAMFQFMDSIYAGGKLEAAGKPPVYVQFKADNLKNGFAYDELNQGDFVFIKADGKSDAVSGIYIGKSFFDGSIIIKMDGIGSITANVFTASQTKSVADVVTGDAATLFVGTSATAVGTDGLELGKTVAGLVETLREHIRGFSNSDQVTERSMDRATGEQGTQSVINLRLWTTSTEMRDVEVRGTLTKTQLRDLKAYGIDGVAELYKAAQNELIQTINDEIVTNFTRLGVANHAQLLVAQGVNLNLFLAPAGTESKPLKDFNYLEFKDTTGTDRSAEFGAIKNAENNSAAENTYTRQRRIYSRILAASALIGTISRYGQGDVAVVNSQIAVALQDCKQFQAVPTENSLGQTSDLHYIGNVGIVRVYLNPKWAWNDMRVSIGRQGAEDQPGLKFFAYDLASSVEVIDSTSFAPQICVTSRFAIEACGFHPEASYLTFVISSGFGEDSWV